MIERKESRKERTTIRLDRQQKDFLNQMSQEHGIPASDIIRIALKEFMSKNGEVGIKYDENLFAQNIYRMVSTSYFLTGKLARKHLDDEEISEAKKKAKANCAALGFEI